MTAPDVSPPPEPCSATDYSTYSQTELISRISTLEALLRTRTADLAALTVKAGSLSSPAPSKRKTSPSRLAKPFNASLYSTRHVALKFSYLGARYNGYEHANGSAPPSRPTVEEVLWKALRKARLISPVLEEDADAGFDVVWEGEERARMYGTGSGDREGKVRLDLNWDGCQYSKCGRTDKGVSAFGQVVGIRLRSNRPLKKEVNGHVNRTATGDEPAEGVAYDEMPGIDAIDLATESYEPEFDPIKDELPYMSILNSILPSDIRILAWCPDPSPDFDARFSCRERQYKYFFTNPAFCPTPGPKGMTYANGQRARFREGWLDIEKMRDAAKKLEGLHDFRNLCKIDPSKQMPSCERRITFADVLEWDASVSNLSKVPQLNANDAVASTSTLRPLHDVGQGLQGPRVYTFAVNGSAFLWHQVRCMVAILFLVGQGLEEPSIVDMLLDVKENPCRPMYEMADDAPLVLWDCVFPDEGSDGKDALDWIYAGDKGTTLSLTAKNDGKFGQGGIADELWSQWRKVKIEETLAGSLFNMAIQQGDGSALQRSGLHDLGNAPPRSQRVFDGSEFARNVGQYIPVKQRPKMETLEEQNIKYASGRLARRQAKKQQADIQD